MEKRLPRPDLMGTKGPERSADMASPSQGVQANDTGDVATLERNAVLENRVDQLQAELGDAKKSLEYMNQLLAALKAHKKATAAAKTALETLRGQLEERNQDIAVLQNDKSKLQKVTQDLEAGFEQSKMSAMNTISASEEFRKQHVAAIRQLEQQHESEVQRTEQEHDNIVEQWQEALHNATQRESQGLVKVIVMSAINKIKTDEASHLRSKIAELRAEAVLTSDADAGKSREIELLKGCISDRDLQIETLLHYQSSDHHEKRKLQDIIEGQEQDKHELEKNVAEAKASYAVLEMAKQQMMENDKAAVQALEQENALLQGRIASLEKSHDDLHATIKIKSEVADDKDRVLAELRADMDRVSGAISAVDQELHTYQLQQRRAHLETVLEDLNLCPGTTVDLQGAVVTCSLHHVPMDGKLELSGSGSVLKNGILRLPYGCTLSVQQATGVLLEDITLQMADAPPTTESDSTSAAAVSTASCPLLEIQPGAQLTVSHCHVSGSCGLGVFVGEGAQLLGTDLWLEACHKMAMEICGGSVDVTGFSLKESGEGIMCTSRAHVTIRNLVAQGSNGRLLAATGGSEVQLHTARLEGGDVALFAMEQAYLDCQGLTVVGGQGSSGVQLTGVGTSARFQASTFNQIDHSALSITNGAVIEMTKCRISECSSDEAVKDSASLQVHGGGSKATVNSSSFHRNSRHCIGCFDGAAVELAGSKFDHNDGCCVLASGLDSHVNLVDTDILDGMGTAVRATHNAVINATSVKLVRCSSGAEAKSSARIVYSKGCIEGCSLRACGSFGGAKLSLLQVQIVSTAGRALHVSGDGSFLHCASCTLLRSSGTQVLCELGATMTLDNVHIAEGSTDGVVIAGPGASAVMNACQVLKQHGAALRVKLSRLAVAGGAIDACGSVAAVEDNGIVQLRDTNISKCQGGLHGTCRAQISATSSSLTHISGTAALTLRGEGTFAHLEDCCIQGCNLGGVLVNAGSKCQLNACKFALNCAPCLHSHGEKASVEVLECTFDGNTGPCIRVADGAVASAKDSYILKTAGDAVCVDGVDSTGNFQRCSLEDTGNHALTVHGGGSCSLDGCSMKTSHAGAGLVALGEGSNIKCEGGYVAGMQQAACVVKHGACIKCTAVHMNATVCGSGAITLAGGIFIARDCLLEDNSDHGVMAAEGGHAQLQACRVLRSRMGCGLFVADPDSRIDANECKVQENGNCGALVAGGGLLACKLCEFVEHIHGAGVVVQGRGSSINMEESTVVGCGAVGLMAFSGGCADCKRVKVSFVEGHGVEAREAGTIVNLQECCVEKCSGYGVLSLDKAAINLLQDCVITGKVGDRQLEKNVVECDFGSLTTHSTAKIVGDIARSHVM